jgi:hypothetical protein
MLRFPVLSEGAEYLVMGHLMRRNILTYKAPPMNEGYDLICIHPDPRHSSNNSSAASSLRIQVKSRYASDCDRAFPIKQDKIECFDFLVVAFLNAGNFLTGRKDGLTGKKDPEFYTLSSEFIREHHDSTSVWQKVRLSGLLDEIDKYKNEQGFEMIAERLGIPPLSR